MQVRGDGEEVAVGVSRDCLRKVLEIIGAVDALGLIVLVVLVIAGLLSSLTHCGSLHEKH